jgi:hypothetical protein
MLVCISAHYKFVQLPSISVMATPALSSIEESFRRFKDTVSASDAREFNRTDLSAVRVAAREIEKQLAAKGEHRALRRIEPFLTGLGHYSEAIGALCNGTPYLPWIWVCFSYRWLFRTCSR